MERSAPGKSRSRRWAAGVPARGHTIEIARALFEGADHAADRLAEQHLDQLLEHAGSKFEIDIEIDAAAARHRLEDPAVGQPPKRTLGVSDIDAPRRGARDARGKTPAGQ